MRRIAIAAGAVLALAECFDGSVMAAPKAASCSDMLGRCQAFCKSGQSRVRCEQFCPSESKNCKQTGTWNGMGGQRTGLKRN